jgi:hypothetical protein
MSTSLRATERLLILKDPTHFAGTISKIGGSMGAGDVIDVAGFDASATVTYSGNTSSGTVTITEAGHTTVTLHIGANSGDWSPPPVLDSTGTGILIHDPPAGTVANNTSASAAVTPTSGSTAPTVITASAFNPILTGTAANDVFVFKPGFGNSTITNFDPANDSINIDHTLFATVANILASAQSINGGADTLDAAHDSIRSSMSRLRRSRLMQAIFTSSSLVLPSRTCPINIQIN